MAYKCYHFHEVLGKCRINQNLKEVEFRHPYFQEKNADIYLCEMHFNIDFEYERKTDQELVREVIRQESNYRKLKAETKRLVTTGVGNDHFDWQNWYNTNWSKVEHARANLRNFRRYFCRYEICRNDLRKNKNIFTIRIYPYDKMKYLTLAYCSENHWDRIKRRIGLILSKPKERKTSVSTLDNFN